MSVILVYYGTALVTLVAIGLTLSGSRGSLWVAALASWFLSFLGSFSIGIYTLVLTFVFLSLAVGTRVGWVETARDRIQAILVGIGLWLLAVRTVNDFWLFFPLSAIGAALS